MEENQYLMWMKRKQVLKSHIEAPYFEANYCNNSSSSCSSWEERAFAEDAARILGGCIWPPRSYSCNFCKREFRSAQALGGHMNVHRRDRARLKQTLITSHPHHNDESSSSLNHHHHHKNNNDFITTRKPSNQEDQKIMSHIWGQKMIESPDDSEQKEGLVVNEESSRPNDDSVVETSLSVGLNLPNDITSYNKRPKTDSSNSLIRSVFIKPCSNFHHQSADFVLGMEDLDLELRLGKPQKA